MSFTKEEAFVTLGSFKKSLGDDSFYSAIEKAFGPDGKEALSQEALSKLKDFTPDKWINAIPNVIEKLGNVVFDTQDDDVENDDPRGDPLDSFEYFRITPLQAAVLVALIIEYSESFANALSEKYGDDGKRLLITEFEDIINEEKDSPNKDDCVGDIVAPLAEFLINRQLARYGHEA